MLLFTATQRPLPHPLRYDGTTVPPHSSIPTSRPISVPLTTPSATYEIVIAAGLLTTLDRRLTKLTNGKLPKVFIVTSPEIWGLWSKTILSSFHATKTKELPTVLFLPPGERHKRMASVETLAQQLAESGADRDSLLLALGGGVIGDITGFLAAIYMRGIRYVQLPTTLLAQVDSALGGKTGVNLVAGKNLIGSFHHPLATLADTNTLATLPPAELRAGLQESIKSGIIYDAKLFRFMEQNSAAILSADPAILAHIIAASIQIKADVVHEDEKESNLRMILNFGHTLGHAIEAATGYKQLLHGEAVGWGSIAATYVSLHRGTITPKEADRIIATILMYGPLPRFTAKAEKLVALTYSDKKTRSGKRAFILPTAIGKVEVVYDVTDHELLAAARTMLATMKRSFN
jgi:3-dehydroquinate synthase